jgi:glycosyltransferase involved in cell wall biosynthesis
MKKKRILYFSSISLNPTIGGYLVMYHHLVAKNDFEVLEINNQVIEEHEKKSPFFRFLNPLINRLRRTRLNRLFLVYDFLFRYKFLPTSLTDKIKLFAPDVVLTVAHGNLFWPAIRVSEKFKIPLVSVYHDWWPVLAQQYIKLGDRSIQRIQDQFRELYTKSHCAFCVCEGMRAELGNHSNSHVLFPMSAEIEDQIDSLPITPKIDNQHTPFLLCYSGNISSGYGNLLRRLIVGLKNHQSIDIRLYGNAQTWPSADQEDASKTGILHPFIPSFKDFIPLLNQASALLTVMSFEEEPEIFRRTSFPSKITVYTAFAKPLVFWAPKESSVAQFVKQYDAGLLVEDPETDAIINALETLEKSPEMQDKFAYQARQLYENIFHPDRIHLQFVQQISALIPSQS